MWRRLLLTATSVAAILALGAGVAPSGSCSRDQ